VLIFIFCERTRFQKSPGCETAAKWFAKDLAIFLRQRYDARRRVLRWLLFWLDYRQLTPAN
jgi:hypothetical protein